MAQISNAGDGLLRFVKAVLAYSTVYRDVQPKRDQISQLEGHCEQVSDYLL